jgi:hypothetical protein
VDVAGEGAMQLIPELKCRLVETCVEAWNEAVQSPAMLALLAKAKYLQQVWHTHGTKRKK